MASHCLTNPVPNTQPGGARASCSEQISSMNDMASLAPGALLLWVECCECKAERSAPWDVIVRMLRRHSEQEGPYLTNGSEEGMTPNQQGLIVGMSLNHSELNLWCNSATVFLFRVELHRVPPLLSVEFVLI